MTCKDCAHYDICVIVEHSDTDYDHYSEYGCEDFKNKADFVEVVRCKDCKHGRPIDKTKSPEKYFKDKCVVCECEGVVGDEPMIYLPTHYCSHGERKDTNG